MVKIIPQKDTFKTFISRAKATLPRRWLWLLIGLGLIVYGLYLMHQREPLGNVNPALELWNTTLRLEMVNVQNVWAGIPYLLSGGVLSALAFLPYWKEQTDTRSITETKEKTDWAYLLPRLAVAILLFSFLIFKLAQHERAPILSWLWVITLALLTYLLYRHERSGRTKLSPQITRVDLAWMAGLFVTGLIIGSFALQDIPKIMVPDEGSFWETGRAIASGDFKPFFFDFGVYTFPIASSIFQGWVMRLVGINLWGWRFASVLAGTLTVIPLYLLAREWFDRRVAVMAALIMLCNPYYLSFTRMGYNNSQALFPVVLSLYFWSVGYKRHSLFYYWLAGMAAGLGFYTYPAAWLGLVTIGITMALLTIIRRIHLRQAAISLTFFMLAIAVTGGPRIVYGASSENAEPLFFKLVETSFISTFYGSAYYGYAELYPDGVAYLIGKNQIFYAPEVYFELLTRSVVRTLAALFDPFIVTEHFLTTNFAGGLLASIGLALGLSLSLRTIKQTRSILLLTWLGAGLFFLSIIAAFPPRHTHLVTIIPALALLSAIGFAASADTLISGIHQRWPPALTDWIAKGLLMLVCGALVFFGIKEYIIVMPTRNPPLFEDIASWLAWRTEEPLTIVYVGPTDRRHRVQYQVDTRMAPHKYVSIAQDDFDWRVVPSKSIVFFEVQFDGKGTQLPKPPDAFKYKSIYTNINGEPLGYAWANTEVDLQPRPPFAISQDKFPVRIVPVLSALAIIVFVFFTLQFRVTAEKISDKPGLRIHTEITLRSHKSKEMEKHP